MVLPLMISFAVEKLILMAGTPCDPREGGRPTLELATCLRIQLIYNIKPELDACTDRAFQKGRR
jgi:hypothetical protein